MENKVYEAGDAYKYQQKLNRTVSKFEFYMSTQKDAGLQIHTVHAVGGTEPVHRWVK